jgi:WD40 repeat protein
MKIDPRSAIPCRTVAFSQDGQYLVEANYLGFVTVRETSGGEIKQRYLAQTALVETIKFEWGTDNLLIVGAGFEGGRDFGTFKVIRFSDGQRLAEFSGHTDDITDIFSIPGEKRRVVTVALDKRVIVHDLENSQNNWIWDEYTDYLNTCSLRPNHSGQFAIAGDSPLSYVLDANQRQSIAKLETPGDSNGLMWSPDGRYLIVGDDHAILKYFDSQENWRQVATVEVGGAIKRMVIDPLDQERALAACYDGRIWAVPRNPNNCKDLPKIIVDRRRGLWGINVDATRNRIAVPSFLDRSYLIERDSEGIGRGLIGSEPNPTYGCNWIAVSNKYNLLAVTHDDGCIRLRDPETGDLKEILGPDSNSLYMGASFHPKLPILATIDFYGEVWLYSLTSGKPLNHFDVGFGPGITAEFSPCGTFLAVGGYRWDTQIFIIDECGDVREKYKLEQPNKGVIKNLCFIDNHRILTACGDGSGVMHVFDGSSWKAEKTFRTDPSMELCNGVAAHPLGKQGFWVSRDQRIHAFNLETGEFIKSGIGHTRSIKTVAVSDCGKFMATGSYDRTVMIWDTQTLQAKLPPLRLANSGISCVRIYKGIIYACSFDGFVVAWDASSGQTYWQKSSLDSSRGL